MGRRDVRGEVAVRLGVALGEPERPAGLDRERRRGGRPAEPGDVLLARRVPEARLLLDPPAVARDAKHHRQALAGVAEVRLAGGGAGAAETVGARPYLPDDRSGGALVRGAAAVEGEVDATRPFGAAAAGEAALEDERALGRGA